MSRRPIILSVIVIALVLAFLGGVGAFVMSLSHGSKWSHFAYSGEVAILEIEGPIFESKKTLKDINDLKEDDSIKAVVIRIDSPGGAVAPSQEIFAEVQKLKEKKKIVVSMGSLAASGGYYIACVADEIVANPGTITGSIGVIMEGFGFQDILKQFKIENRVLKTGDFKDVGNPFREMGASEKEYLQQILYNMYNQFKKAVATSRHLAPEVVDDLAQGKIYTGEQAVEKGLVDKLGTIYDAIEEAKVLAGLQSDANVIWPRESSTPWGAFADSIVTFMLDSVEGGLKSRSGSGQVKPLYMWH